MYIIVYIHIKLYYDLFVLSSGVGLIYRGCHVFGSQGFHISPSGPHVYLCVLMITEG